MKGKKGGSYNSEEFSTLGVQDTSSTRGERKQRRYQSAKAMEAAKGDRLANIKAKAKMRR